MMFAVSPHQQDSSHSSGFYEEREGRWLKEALCDATTAVAPQFASAVCLPLLPIILITL